MQDSDQAQPAPTRSVRLIFEYDGDGVRLVGQQPVEMVVTGSEIATAQQFGYFVDTRDPSGRMLTRVRAPNAFSQSMEVFPENHADPIERVEVAKPHGAFTVVVPAPVDADHFSVVRVMPPAAGTATREVGGGAEVREIARFPLNSAK